MFEFSDVVVPEFFTTLSSASVYWPRPLRISNIEGVRSLF